MTLKNIYSFAFIIFLSSVFSISVKSQIISGQVVSAEDKKPLGFCNVFLNNTQKGTMTDEQGKFVLSGLANGAYELIVSYIGYYTYVANIKIQGEIIDLRIELKPNTIQLEEIVVKEDKNWKYNYETFVRNFIGETPLGSQCEITNPDILNIRFYVDSALLKVKAKEPLVIENKALGYRIKYLLEEFRMEFKSGYLGFYGYAFFEEIKTGNIKQVKKWEKNRQEAYLGSSLHFIRSLHQKNLENEGFIARKLIRKPNPDRKPEEVIRQAMRGLAKSNIHFDSDTMTYWRKEAAKPKIIETLVAKPLAVDSLITQVDSISVLRFTDYLHVVYTKEKEDNAYLAFSGNPNRNRGYQTSVIDLLKPYAVIEPNGVLQDPLAWLFEGYWAWQEKIAELLPLDYQLVKPNDR
jgi:hypothetical protein